MATSRETDYGENFLKKNPLVRKERMGKVLSALSAIMDDRSYKKLLEVIQKKNGSSSSCVVVQFKSDNRLKVQGTKGAKGTKLQAHLLLFRHFIDPDTKLSELHSNNNCNTPYHLSRQKYCVNPWHYFRVVPLVSGLSASNVGASQDQNINGHTSYPDRENRLLTLRKTQTLSTRKTDCSSESSDESTSQPRIRISKGDGLDKSPDDLIRVNKQRMETKGFFRCDCVLKCWGIVSCVIVPVMIFIVLWQKDTIEKLREALQYFL